MMDQVAAVFRSNQGIYQHLYDVRMDPLCPMLTPDQFLQSCLWPGDRPVYFGGGEHQGVAEDDERTTNVEGDVMDHDVTPQFPVLKISLNKSHKIRVRLKRSVTFHLKNNLDNHLSFTKILS